MVWDANTHELIAELTGHTVSIVAIAFSPTNPTILCSVGDEFDQSVIVWSLKEGKSLVNLKNNHKVHGTAFTADGHDLITAGVQGHLKIWHLEAFLSSHETSSIEGRQVQLKSGTSRASEVTFCDVICSKSGVFALSAKGAIYQVNVSSKSATLFAELKKVSQSMTCRGDTLYVSCANGLVQAVNSDLQWTYPGDGVSTVCARLSQDGTHMMAFYSNRSSVVWDLSTGKVVRVLPAHDGSVWGVVATTTGFVTCSHDKSVRFWNKQMQCTHHIFRHRRALYRQG